MLVDITVSGLSIRERNRANRCAGGGAGIGAMLTTRLACIICCTAIAERFANVCCASEHPHYASEELDVRLAQIVERAAHPNVSRSARQADISTRQPHSRQSKVPLHIEAARKPTRGDHSRDSDKLRPRSGRGDGERAVRRGLALYTAAMLWLGSVRTVLTCLLRVLTFNKSDELRAVAAGVPLDRLLVETDAPYLARCRARPTQTAVYVAHATSWRRSRHH